MTTLLLPAALNGASNATVRRWFVAPGGAITAGQVLVELDTNDALVRVTAAAAGTLISIAAPVGTTVAAGGTLGETTVAESRGRGVAESTAPTAAAAPNVAVAVNDPATPRPRDPATAILMPQAGNSMEEGRIIAWRVKAGDAITIGQILCEIETDKSTIEFESPVAGVIGAIATPAGGVQAVKQPIAYLNDGAVTTIAESRGRGVAESTVAATSSSDSDAATPRPRDSATAILMPQAGNSMEEGRIIAWRVKAGDAITIGQILCEIETDKSTIEFESPIAGIIGGILTPAGGVQKVKLPIAHLNDGAAPSTTAVAESRSRGVAESTATIASSVSDLATPRPRDPATAVSPDPVTPRPRDPATAVASGRVPASPAARKLATEKGVDLASVSGSGPGGRVLSTDVATAKPAAKGEKSDAKKAVVTIPRPTGPVGEAVTRPLTKMRKAIATNLQMSKQTVPHFYVKVTVDAGPLLAFAKAQKAATGCSVNDVVMAGLARAMSAFPALRSRWSTDGITELPTANIGIAVGIPDGLVVPVVMQVDRLSLTELASESKRVVEAARKGKLENLGRASFTVSNLGMFGVEEFSAIINPPEAGILAVSAAREEVIVANGAMRPGRVMTLTLSADHRIVDGLLAAQFVQALKGVLEAPEQLC